MDSSKAQEPNSPDAEDKRTDITELPIPFFSSRVFIRLKDLVGVIIFLLTLGWNIKQYIEDKEADQQVAQAVKQHKAETTSYNSDAQAEKTSSKTKQSAKKTMK